MLHPDTRLSFLSPIKGFGIIATAPIPKGTITFVQDELDIVIPEGDRRLVDPRYQSIIDRYSYIDHRGNHVISWDNGRYMNHCCHANTLTTGYGFEIAVRDIAPGEEVTDDYGLFTITHDMEIECDATPCRNCISKRDFPKLVKTWDEKIQPALAEATTVDQPLWSLLDDITQQAVQKYVSSGKGYRSVRRQRPSKLQQSAL